MKFLSDILAKAGLIVDGVVTLNSVANSSVDTDKFLVIESNVVKYRTGTQILSDIGAAAAAAGLPVGGTAGQILAKIDGTNYNAQWIDNYASQLKHIVKLAQNITIGTPVYVSSADGTNMIVSKASYSTEQTSSKVLGLLAEGGVTNDQRFVITEGLLAGINTSTANAGDPVWLGANGALLFGLANKPVAPNHMVYLGVVTRVQQNNGEIFVKVQNGFEIDELHDVLVSGLLDKHILYRDATTNLWKNASISTVLGYTPANATSISGTVNRIAKFTSTSAVGDSQIFDNGTNVSIGTLTPISTSILTLTGTNVLTKSIFLDSTWSYQTSFSMRNGIYYTEFNLGGATKSNSEGGPGSFQIAHYNSSTAQYIIPITFFANGNIAFAGGTASVPSDQGQTLQVQGSTRISALAGTGTRVVVANASGVLSTGAVSSSITTGSGTTNYVSKWTPDGVTLGNSQIFDNGTSIGVGLTSPLAKFHVNGSIRSSAFEDQVFTYAGAVQQTYTTGLGFNSDVITKDGTSATFVMANNIATQVKHTGVGSNYVANYALGASAEVGGTTANALIYGAGGYFISRRRYSDDISTNGNNGMYGVVARVIIDPPAPSTMRTATLYAIDAGLTLNSGTTTTAAGVEISANFGTSNSSTPGIVTDYFGIRIRGTIGSATGGTAIVTNYYGLYIANPTINATGNTATRWAIYSLDTSASYIQGSLLVGTTTNANYKVDINGTLRSSDSAYFATSSGNVTIGNLAGTGTRLVTADANGVLGVSGLASGIVTGSGTSNYIPKWTPNSTTLGNSQLQDNGTNVGIGVTTLQSAIRLDVRPAPGDNGIAIAGYGYGGNGGAGLNGIGYATTGTGSTYGIYASSFGVRAGGTNIGGYFDASGAASNYALITGVGNVGIGTSTPNVRLEVSGLVRVTGANGFSIGADGGQNRIQYSTSTFSRFALLSSGDNYAGLTAKELSIGATYGGIAPPSSGVIVEGNVGIGLTNPGAKLAVQETANSTAFDVANVSTATFMPSRMLASFRGVYNSGANGHQLYLTSGTTDTSAWDMNFTKTWGGFITFGVSADGTTVTRQLAIATDRVGIGTTSPVASAKLDITSTTQGFLPPRMTAAQRGAISSPAIGLVVYQTDGNEGLWIYTNGNGWKALAIVL